MTDKVDYYANPAEVPQGTLVELFFEAVDRLADKPAYGAPAGSGGPPMSYAQVEEQVRRGATALGKSGLERGDKAAILSENRVEWALADWSCLCAGVVSVPVYSTLPAAQVAYILRDSEASLVFASDAEQAAKAREAASGLGRPVEVVVFGAGAEAEAGAGTGSGSKADAESGKAADGFVAWEEFLARGDAGAGDEAGDGEAGDAAGDAKGAFRSRALEATPDQVATMIYTSGTTGAPKGVMLTHQNVSSNVWASRQMLEVGDGDSTLSFLPLSHVFQRMVDYLCFSGGCTITHGAIDHVADDIKALRPTLVCSVPRLYEKVYQKVLDADGLKGKLVAWASGVAFQAARYRERGTALPAGLRWKHALADRLVFEKLRQGVGGRLRFFVSGGAALAPEINRFFLGAGITILEGYGLSETSPVTNVNTRERFRIGTVGRPVPGTELRIADDGEILVRGPQVMKGYHGLEEQTRQVVSEDGWFSTGDIGELSADGFLAITDRKKDLIKTSGGKYVAPQAIENLLKGNPYVDQAVVVGDGRKFVSVLVVPAVEKLAGWAGARGAGGQGGAGTAAGAEASAGEKAGAEAAESALAALVADPRCQAFLEEEIFGALRDLAKFETPKKIGLLHEPFTIENGVLTPTQKVKRRVVAERYAELVDEFYAPASVDRTVFVAGG